jgi:sigma-B regulation protein RsbU (phosphoserine phosphatase)
MEGAAPEMDPDRVDLRTLVSHDRSVPASTTAEALQTTFERLAVDFVAVVDGEKLLGMCSRRQLANQLSSRYGFALYARQPANAFLMPAPLMVTDQTPITDVFKSASGRDARDFYDDVALVNEEGRYVGMIPMLTLVRLQTEFLLRNNERLEKSRLEIASKNRVLEEDMLMAREVQLAMQPQSHEPLLANGHTLRLAHRYRPAGSVSGDFFDVLRISDDAAGILVCDVMGHGVRSALITAMIRAMLEELRPMAAEPGALLTRLNRDLAGILRQGGEVIFVTAAYSVIHLGVGRIRYAQAGHPTPFRWDNRTQVVRAVACPDESAGPALGLIDDFEFTTVEESFSDGDRLAVFTDGVVEASNSDGGEFGTERLAQSLARGAGLPLSEGLDLVLREVAEFSGGSFADDVCIVAAELNSD